jgi:DNA polymerase
MKIENIIDDIKERLKFHLEIGNGTFIFKKNNEKKVELITFKEKIDKCTLCPLSSSRINIVVGEGNTSAELMFVGEAPGEEEDKQGRPFVGKAGQLLNRIISAMGLKREDVYITNIIKCRPPKNRDPKTDEIDACINFLIEQIDIIKPKIIVALGRISAQILTGKNLPITELRGNFYSFRGINVLPTYHPAYLIRNEGNINLKRQVWNDMKKVMSFLGLK